MSEHPKYEVHIVGYAGELVGVPRPFFLNEVKLTTQGMTGIATVETDSLSEVYAAYVDACQWCERQRGIQSEFGAHAKAEQYKEIVMIDFMPRIKPLSQRVSFRSTQSYTVAAWDVHMDGEFDPALIEDLLQQGYIRLDYVIRGSEEVCTTMTLHFIRPESCILEFERIKLGVLECGGFKGELYWEDPLAFVVVGPTLPRPIVIE